MGEANELLLRSLVAHNRQINNYFDDMATLSLKPQPVQRRVVIRHDAEGWTYDEAA
jgi:DNA-directed RNA polymerase specialized sigma24 family protein